MKNKKVIFSILSILVMVTVLSLNPFNVKANSKTNEKLVFQKDIYKDKISKEKFKNSSTIDQKKSLNIKVDKNTTTKQLVIYVVNYPYLSDINAFDTTEQALNFLSLSFDPLKELLLRNDCIAELENYYYSLNDKISSLDKNVLSENQSELVMQSMTLKEMLNYLKKSDSKSNTSSFRLFNTNSNDIDSEYQKILNTISEKKEQTNNSSTGINLTPLSTTYVKTPNGTPVPIIIYEGFTYTPLEIVAINAQYKNLYPNAVLYANPNKRYNCHSYCWYQANGSNPYWMNDPSAYMNDGSYKQTTTLASGVRAYWGNRYHSAVVSKPNGANTLYFSKWGSLGLYLHSDAQCPYGYPSTFWKR